ncbi:MAG: hypothetical protein ACYS1A_17085 [Planctomycetota bacterium]|jgi:hypothetical protein
MKKLEILDVDMVEGVTTATVLKTLKVTSWKKKPNSTTRFGTRPVQYNVMVTICGSVLGGEIVRFMDKYYNVAAFDSGMAGNSRIFLDEDKNPNA